MGTWTRADFVAADAAGKLQAGKPELLAEFMDARYASATTFTFKHVTVIGLMLVAAGMVGFFALQNMHRITYEEWMVFIGAIILASIVGSYVARQAGEHVFASTLAFLAVCATPTFVYCFQMKTGWRVSSEAASLTHRLYFTLVDSFWLPMELATLGMAAVLFAWHRLPFVLMPTVVTIWFMSMDYSRLVIERLEAQSHDEHMLHLYKDIFPNMSIKFGLATLVAACLVRFFDTTRRDMAYWLFVGSAWSYLAGITAKYALVYPTVAANMHIYGLLCVVLFSIGALTGRGAFLLGGVGMLYYLGYLVDKLFAHMESFPLIVAGLCVVGAVAVLYGAKHWQAIVAPLRSIVPAFLRPDAHR